MQPSVIETSAIVAYISTASHDAAILLLLLTVTYAQPENPNDNAVKLEKHRMTYYTYTHLVNLHLENEGIVGRDLRRGPPLAISHIIRDEKLESVKEEEEEEMRQITLAVAFTCAHTYMFQHVRTYVHACMHSCMHACMSKYASVSLTHDTFTYTHISRYLLVSLTHELQSFCPALDNLSTKKKIV